MSWCSLYFHIMLFSFGFSFHHLFIHFVLLFILDISFWLSLYMSPVMSACWYTHLYIKVAVSFKINIVFLSSSSICLYSTVYFMLLLYTFYSYILQYTPILLPTNVLPIFFMLAAFLLYQSAFCASVLYFLLALLLFICNSFCNLLSFCFLLESAFFLQILSSPICSPVSFWFNSSLLW